MNNYKLNTNEKTAKLPKEDIESGIALFLAQENYQVRDVLSQKECDLSKVRSAKIKKILNRWVLDKDLFVELINRKELREHICYDDILQEIFNLSLKNGYYDVAKKIISSETMEYRSCIAKNCIDKVEEIFPNTELYYLLDEINCDSYNDYEL